MSRKEDEAFAGWKQDLKAKLASDEEREAFEKWADTPQGREVYRGTIGQAELYRRMNELHQRKQELEEWYEAERPKNDELLKEREALLAQLEELGSGGPPPASSAPEGLPISKKELEEIKSMAAKAETLDRLLPAVLGDVTLVMKDAIKNNFDIDPREVIKLSLQRGVEPYRAYLELTGEERQKRYEAERKKELEDAFEKGRRAAMTNSPDHLQPSGPSVVDYLRDLNKEATKAPDKDDRVAAALKEFSEGTF